MVWNDEFVCVLSMNLIEHIYIHIGHIGMVSLLYDIVYEFLNFVIDCIYIQIGHIGMVSLLYEFVYELLNFLSDCIYIHRIKYEVSGRVDYEVWY